MNNFLTDKGLYNWFDEFYQIMRHQNFAVRFNCQLRADQVKENYDRLLEFQKIGLVGVFVGIESFLQKHLDFYRKGTSVHTNLEAVQLLSSMKLNVRIGYLLFNPLTTLDDILQTIQFFRKYEINKNKIILDNLLSASVMISYPGTPVEQEIHKNYDFSLNLRGYRIRDNKSELCYQIMKKWNKLLANRVKNIADGMYKSREKEALLSKLFYLDLEVLETVSLVLKWRLRAADYFDSYLDRSLLTARKIISSKI